MINSITHKILEVSLGVAACEARQIVASNKLPIELVLTKYHKDLENSRKRYTNKAHSNNLTSAIAQVQVWLHLLRRAKIWGWSQAQARTGTLIKIFLWRQTPLHLLTVETVVKWLESTWVRHRLFSRTTARPKTASWCSKVIIWRDRDHQPIKRLIEAWPILSSRIFITT